MVSMIKAAKGIRVESLLPLGVVYTKIAATACRY